MLRIPTAAAALAALCAAVLLAAGCGQEDEGTPVACLDGAGPYLTALQAAPGEVLVGGETPISDCLAENQAGGELATVGGALLEAATELNAEARDEPSGGGALRLGYLVGAAQRGAESTSGIHTDLVRRLTVAARFAPGKQPLSPRFLDAYRQGFDAGRESG